MKPFNKYKILGKHFLSLEGKQEKLIWQYMNLYRKVYLIIDDYLCFDNKNIERIYKQCKNFNGNIYIFSTPKKQFDKKLFEKIKQIKENNVKSIWSAAEFLKLGNLNEIEELYFNFITDPDCNIIFDETHSYFINEFIRKESENWVNNL
ncbi:hypothetical protein M0P65_07980, partial [Candidatus Gracilibacteria bacterium]|nr:hypothetical protein [Candidatus Gracilibacteria bacterium]